MKLPTKYPVLRAIVGFISLLVYGVLGVFATLGLIAAPVFIFWAVIALFVFLGLRYLFMMPFNIADERASWDAMIDGRA
jgi:hypothetical protein